MLLLEEGTLPLALKLRMRLTGESWLHIGIGRYQSTKYVLSEAAISVRQVQQCIYYAVSHPVMLTRAGETFQREKTKLFTEKIRYGAKYVSRNERPNTAYGP